MLGAYIHTLGPSYVAKHQRNVKVEIYMNCSYLETFSPGLNMKHTTKENKDTLGTSNQTNKAVPDCPLIGG